MKTMSITATELKKNLGYYLDLSRTTTIFVTKNGKIWSKFSPANERKIASVESLFGILPNDASLEDAHKERAKQHGWDD